MKNIKDELQHIILGHEPAGQSSQLKKVQYFLRSNAEASFAAEKQQRFKGEETAALLAKSFPRFPKPDNRTAPDLPFFCEHYVAFGILLS